MPATFIFTKFVLNTLNKYLHYGNHGGTGSRNSGKDVANQPTPPPGASLEGIRQGRFMRVLLSSTMRPRKINFY